MAPDATLKDLFLNGLVHLFPLTLPDQTLAFYTAGTNKRMIKKFTNAKHIFLWEVFFQLPPYLLLLPMHMRTLPMHIRTLSNRVRHLA